MWIKLAPKKLGNDKEIPKEKEIGMKWLESGLISMQNVLVRGYTRGLLCSPFVSSLFTTTTFYLPAIDYFTILLLFLSIYFLSCSYRPDVTPPHLYSTILFSSTLSGSARKVKYCRHAWIRAPSLFFLIFSFSFIFILSLFYSVSVQYCSIIISSG